MILLDKNMRSVWCRVWVLLVAVFLSAACRTLGQADIVVRKTGAEKSLIDIEGLALAPGKDAAEFIRTLEGDLVRSGWFTVVPRGRGAISLRGSFTKSGRSSSVSCEVVNPGSGRSYLRSRLSEPTARRLAHVLSDKIVQAVKGVRGIASTRIAMIGAHGAGKDVYICDSDGGNLVKVTNEGAVCLSPRWWPGADALTYTSFHASFPDVYKIDLAANRRTKLAGFPGLNAGAAISPDGRSMALVLSKDGNPELYVMDLRSRRLTRMTRTPKSSEASPSWSPDGKQLVFVSDTTGSPQVYVIGTRNSRPRRISFHRVESVAPDWGADGRIAYSGRRRSERYQICVYDPSSGRTDQLTSENVDHEDPAWAPDGRHIVCAKTRNFKSDLYVLDTMGDASVRLTTMQGDWYSPAWSLR